MTGRGVRSDLPWTFNSFEMGIVGYKNSGKTTLIEKLVPLLKLDLAYVKHDAHSFEMDHEGKDTFRISAAGAKVVAISGSDKNALLRPSGLHPVLSCLDFLEQDAVLVEGYKDSSLPKIVVLDESLSILNDPAFRGKPPLAVVGASVQPPSMSWNVPYFCRDNLGDISVFIQSYWLSLVKNRPLCGLVLTGGKSVRMGRDKAAINYRGQEQAVHAFQLLEAVCDEVFVSCRAEQSDLPGRRGLPQIHDKLLDAGPLSGILAALEFRPDAAWLVVACDLPRLNAQVLERLIQARNPFRFATAYSGFEGFPEPLCTIYEPKSFSRFYQFLAAGHSCPRKMLINSPLALLEPLDPGSLVNVNDETTYAEVIHDWGA
ncbi:MAG: molybdopterin-guanine dinucleotide biosynthesis protein B [Spirochaetales bacterium]|nr:molybdopterin-guanine dinucleotide biosynthesis protein B [Spirochaetales bacterium]